MASPTVHAAGTTLKQHARRPMSRIVPAIPHRLARAPPSAARPITPEQSSKSAVPQSQALPELHAHEGKQLRGGEDAVAEVPLTPESRTSDMDKSDTDAAPPVHSPPTSQGDAAENGVQVPGADTNGHVEQTAVEAPMAAGEARPTVNGSRRKLTIPSHLPPPFYPSNKADSPTPPVQSPDVARISAHRHQLSAGALVFQSANGSPATPATPQESEQEIHYPHQHPQPVAPGLDLPQYIGFVPSQFQHPTESGAPWVHPPYAVAPLEQVHDHGTDFRSPQDHMGFSTQVEPFESHLPSTETTLGANGAIPLQSQSPDKTQFGGPKLASDYGEEHRAVQYQNAATHPAEHLEQSPFELAAYLSTQFANPEFADFILQIRSPESALISIPVHGIVVVRSPVIAEAVRRSPAPAHRSRDARRIIDVMAIDPFVTRESLEEAVKVLYGAPLLLPQAFLYGLGPSTYDTNPSSPATEARRRMQQVLSYIAAAKTLQIPSMQARGVEIARMLLRWDTVDQVLRYGLKANSARTETGDAEDLFTVTLMNYAIDFIAYTFPVDFKLYTIAAEFQDAPRLPVLLESRPPTHNPRLSKIRFGDAPPEDNTSSSHLDRVLSAILLSLPPQLLDHLFNHRATANQIGWTGAVRLLGDVIGERENRRLKTLRGQLKPAQDGLVPATLLNNMYTEEQVETSPIHPSGYTVATTRSAVGT
ncbi:hypothetical protein ACN47E_006426 [Coniothyrium glycines]